MKKAPELSIIIPAYNEEARLPSTLDNIHEYLDKKNITFEVIVVDDGSSDRTAAVAEESRLAGSGKLRVVSNKPNKGKGYSVRSGILGSHGKYVLFSDADLSTPITELDKLRSVMDDGYDIVMASRSIKGSVLRVRQPWHRRTMGRIFNLFIKMLLFSDYNDTQCGFKLFKGDVAREIAGKMKISGFCFDAEMLYIAKKSGYKIKETGVIWDNSPESKVTVLNSSFSMFTDLIRIKKWHG